MNGFNKPADIDCIIVQSPQSYSSCFLNFPFGVVSDMQSVYSRIPCPMFVLFSFTYCFPFKSKPVLLSGDQTPVNMEWY
jgi:hypothetical protein